MKNDDYNNYDPLRCVDLSAYIRKILNEEEEEEEFFELCSIKYIQQFFSRGDIKSVRVI